MKGFKSLVRGAAISCIGLVFAQAAVAATGTVQFRTGSEPAAKCGTTSTPSVSVDLQVASLSDAVNGVQVRFSYAPAVLTLFSATPASGWSQVSFIDSSGLVTYALVNNGGSVGPVGGPFTVATLVFTVVAQGNTAITFQADSPPFTTRLTTADLNPVVISGANLTKSPSGAISIDNTTATASNNGPICEGSALNLTGGTTGSLPNPPYSFSWSGPLSYSSGIQSPQVSASATPAMSGTYTVTVTNGQGCTFQANTSVTVNPSPVAPTSASASPSSYCADVVPGTGVDLTAVGGSGTTLEWSLTCGGAVIGTGTPFHLVTAPTSTTTYFARWTNGCGGSSCASTTVTVNAVAVAPTSASASPSSYCADVVPGTGVDLTAVGGSGTTLEWSLTCGGAVIGTGTPFHLVTAPTSTTTYFARWTNGCGGSSCASTTVTVNAVAVAPTSASASPSSYCADVVPGTGVDLTAVGGSGATLEWSLTCGGTPIGTGTPLHITAPTSTTTYFARWTNGCGGSSCASTTVTVNAVAVAPTSASASPSSYCADVVPGTGVDLTAVGGSGTTLEWSLTCGGAVIGTGTPFHLVTAPTSTTTYFARWTNSCGGSSCASTTVTVNAVAVAPTSASASPSSYCADVVPGTGVDLTAVGGSGATLEWSLTCGGTPIGTGTPLHITAPTSTTTYFARWTNGCGGSSCASTTVTVNAVAVAPTSASASPSSYCANAVPGTGVDLTAVGGSGATLEWSLTCGGAVIGTGTPFHLVTAPTSTTTYFARWTNGCGGSSCASTTVTVNAVAVAPTSASASPSSYCADVVPGTGVDLTAVGGSGTTLEWSLTCGGAVIGTGTPFHLVTAPTSTTTYFARWTNGCGGSSCASTTVTVNAVAVAPTSASASPSSYCANAVPGTGVDLTAVGGSGATLEWSLTCGGTPIGTGTPLHITAPTSTTTYFARWTNGCGGSSCASTTVTVNAVAVAPTSASASPSSYCANAVPGTGVDLTAVGGSGATLEWSLTCGGTPIGTGTPLHITAPTSTTTYFARWTNGCGGSSCASTTVTVNAVAVAPTSASASPSSYCANAVPGTGVDLTAVGGSGATLEWSLTCGGTPIGTGTPLHITAPTSTTTYFARWTNGCGGSSCASTTVTVNAVAVAPTGASSDRDNFCSDDAGTITLTATGGSGTLLHWFDTSCGVSEIGTGNGLVIPSPAVTTTYYVRWTNACGNSTCASVTVTVTHCVTVNLQIPGLIGGVAENAPVATRAVDFDVTTCPGTLDHRDVDVNFVRTGGNGTATVVLTGVNPAATWLSVVEGHTLRKLVPIDLSVNGSAVAAVSLISGDFQTATVAQDALVDIVDFSILASRWNQTVADCGVGPNPQNCSLGADATGDGSQNTADFTAVMVNFFLTGDGVAGCPGGLADPGSGGRGRPDVGGRTEGSRLARTSITKGELSAIDTQAVNADFNGDNVIDAKDIRQFAQLKGLTITPTIETKLQQMELLSASVISPKKGK